eukprot:5552113-Prymnesium_polylepis.1
MSVDARSSRVLHAAGWGTRRQKPPAVPRESARNGLSPQQGERGRSWPLEKGHARSGASEGPGGWSEDRPAKQRWSQGWCQLATKARSCQSFYFLATRAS